MNSHLASKAPNSTANFSVQRVASNSENLITLSAFDELARLAVDLTLVQERITAIFASVPPLYVAFISCQTVNAQWARAPTYHSDGNTFLRDVIGLVAFVYGYAWLAAFAYDQRDWSDRAIVLILVYPLVAFGGALLLGISGLMKSGIVRVACTLALVPLMAWIYRDVSWFGIIK